MSTTHDTAEAITKRTTKIALISAIILTSGASMALTGCIAAAAGAGAGYAVGHESGEDHVTEGKHPDDD